MHHAEPPPTAYGAEAGSRPAYRARSSSSADGAALLEESLTDYPPSRPSPVPQTQTRHTAPSATPGLPYVADPESAWHPSLRTQQLVAAQRSPWAGEPARQTGEATGTPSDAHKKSQLRAFPHTEVATQATEEDT